MSERIPNGFHLLVVEDNAELREVLALALNLQGYSVACADNGMHALAMLKTGHSGLPDLVITDLQMPGDADGWWLRQNMLDDDELVSVPVVVLSAAIPREGRDVLKASAYLKKPVMLDTLLEAIEDTLGGIDTIPGAGSGVVT